VIRTVFVALPATLALISVAPRDAATERQSHNVRIKAFAYLPESLSVSRGDTIIFLNEDIVAHTITADTAKWDSGDLRPRQSFRLVTPARGRISFHCELHPAMRGQVVVR
jgi:plastocyanin